jgi:hypothetical protein
MSKEQIAQEFRQMWLELTDDDIIAENKRKSDRKKRIEAKRIDVGL